MLTHQQPGAASIDPAVTFPRFMDMPLEVRRMVYKEAMPPVVPQVQIYHSETFPRWDQERGDWLQDDEPLTVAVTIPAILHVCAESREFALEHVQIRRLKKKAANRDDADSHHHVVCRLFNKKTDVIFIHPKHFWKSTEVFSWEMHWVTQMLLSFEGVTKGEVIKPEFFDTADEYMPRHGGYRLTKLNHESGKELQPNDNHNSHMWITDSPDEFQVLLDLRGDEIERIHKSKHDLETRLWTNNLMKTMLFSFCRGGLNMLGIDETLLYH